MLYVVASFADDVPPDASLPVRRALALLEEDVRHADAVGLGTDGAAVVLVGDLWLGEAGRTFRPCRVEWRLEEAAGGQVLVRSQRRDGGSDATLVLAGVDGFVVGFQLRSNSDMPPANWTQEHDPDAWAGQVRLYGDLTVGGVARPYDFASPGFFERRPR